MLNFYAYWSKNPCDIIFFWKNWFLGTGKGGSKIVNPIRNSNFQNYGRIVVDSLKRLSRRVEKENKLHQISPVSWKWSNLTFFVKSDHFCQKRSFLTKNVKFEHFRDTVPIRCFLFIFSTLRDKRFKLPTTILP